MVKEVRGMENAEHQKRYRRLNTEPEGRHLANMCEGHRCQMGTMGMGHPHSFTIQDLEEQVAWAGVLVGEIVLKFENLWPLSLMNSVPGLV